MFTHSLLSAIDVDREEHHTKHHAVIDAFKDVAERMGKEVVVRGEEDAKL